MKKQLSLSFLKQYQTSFNEYDKQFVRNIADKIEFILAQNNISKLVNVGNSFSWMSDYLSCTKDIDVSFFSYSGSSLTEDSSKGYLVESYFNLPFYRKNISSESLNILHKMFNHFGLTVESLLTTKRLYLDMCKSGKGIRSFLHELELFITVSDVENKQLNLKKFRQHNIVLVYQPSKYLSNNIKHTLFNGYKLLFLSVAKDQELYLENFCDNDEIRLVPSNPIDKNFKFLVDKNKSQLSLSKQRFFNK